MKVTVESKFDVGQEVYVATSYEVVRTKVKAVLIINTCFGKQHICYELEDALPQRTLDGRISAWMQPMYGVVEDDVFDSYTDAVPAVQVKREEVVQRLISRVEDQLGLIQGLKAKQSGHSPELRDIARASLGLRDKMRKYLKVGKYAEKSK